jgi:hypothetical protein
VTAANQLGITTMGEKDQACREVMNNVDGAVACGIVELSTGKLLGFHALKRTPALEEAIVAATLSMLCRRSGRNAAGPEESMALEVHVVSGHGYHFARVLEGGKSAVMLVTSRSTNAGMGSAQFKAVIPKVEP